MKRSEVCHFHFHHLMVQFCSFCSETHVVNCHCEILKHQLLENLSNFTAIVEKQNKTE